MWNTKNTHVSPIYSFLSFAKCYRHIGKQKSQNSHSHWNLNWENWAKKKRNERRSQGKKNENNVNWMMKRKREKFLSTEMHTLDVRVRRDLITVKKTVSLLSACVRNETFLSLPLYTRVFLLCKYNKKIAQTDNGKNSFILSFVSTFSFRVVAKFAAVSVWRKFLSGFVL